MADYLSLPAVRDALHVKKYDFFSVDNAEGDFDYIPSERDLTGFYKEVNGRLRILIYNGGTLAVVIGFMCIRQLTLPRFEYYPNNFYVYSKTLIQLLTALQLRIGRHILASRKLKRGDHGLSTHVDVWAVTLRNMRVTSIS
jgi:hypothetical protein